MADRLNDAPLGSVCVLELVQNDDWVHGRKESAEALTSGEKVANIGREQIEADAAFLLCQAPPFSIFCCVFGCPFGIGKSAVSPEAKANSR